LKDGKIIAARGEPFVLRVTPREGSVAPESVTLRTEDDRGEGAVGQFTKFGAADYRYDFSSLTVPLKVEVEGGDDVLEPFMIVPVDRPRVTSLELGSPAPTVRRNRRSTTSAAKKPTCRFLPQTNLALRFATNVPIAEAHLKSATTKPAAGDLQRIDDTHFA
jgi:hypothetical protein